MPVLFIGLLALALILWLLKSLARVDPRYLIKVGRTAGGIIALAIAAFMGVRGELAVALPLGVTGLSLLGWRPQGTFGFWPVSRPSPGKVSRVRSNFLDVALDHDTGKMTGTIINGRLTGTPLDEIEVSGLVALLREFDTESRDLLAAYLDRRQPRWRDDIEESAAPGRSDAGRTGKMTEQEAYQILGLQPGAGADEIGRAHRGLMKKLHPDQGGSTYLAARVNEAKDVLLRRH
jgi:DnaJ-like protein